jgi:UDP-glucuronate 4-epimerase
MKILVTGAAGFIGFHLVRRLVERGDDVIGLDSLEGFYPIEMKKARLRECGVLLGDDVSMGETVRSELFDNYRFVYASLGDKERLDRLFGELFVLTEAL